MLKEETRQLLRSIGEAQLLPNEPAERILDFAVPRNWSAPTIRLVEVDVVARPMTEEDAA